MPHSLGKIAGIAFITHFSHELISQAHKAFLE